MMARAARCALGCAAGGNRRPLSHGRKRCWHTLREGLKAQVLADNARGGHEHLVGRTAHGLADGAGGLTGVSRPISPVAAFAMPELTTTARTADIGRPGSAPSFRCCGTHGRRRKNTLVVKVAAAAQGLVGATSAISDAQDRPKARVYAHGEKPAPLAALPSGSAKVSFSVMVLSFPRVAPAALIPFHCCYPSLAISSKPQSLPGRGRTRC